MISRIFRSFKCSSFDLATSRLYSEQNFYPAFERDLLRCRDEAMVESPFITTRRIQVLLPMLRKMVSRGIRVTINTRHPAEHEDYMRAESEAGIALLQNIGVEVLFTGGHHRKLAIFDRQILWEGSLNILSQNDSCEVMRRISSRQITEQMVEFLGLERYLR